MSYKEGMVLPEKFKKVKITLKERIREVLNDIVNGMEFLNADKSWAESLFIALSERMKEEDGIILDIEPDFGNMLRELDAIFLEATVTSVLIREIREDLDPETRKKFQDRKLKARKPIENLHRFLASN